MLTQGGLLHLLACLQFERHRDIRNPREVARVLDAAEKQLKEYLHPDPYKRE